MTLLFVMVALSVTFAAGAMFSAWALREDRVHLAARQRELEARESALATDARRSEEVLRSIATKVGIQMLAQRRLDVEALHRAMHDGQSAAARRRS